MKTSKSIQIVLALIISSSVLIDSCTKDNNLSTILPLSTLNVTNALPTSTSMIVIQGTTGPVYTNFIAGSPQFGNYPNFLGVGTIASYGSGTILSIPSGADTIYTVQKNADTLMIGGKISKYMFNQVLNLTANSVYSLFITGKDTTAPDYLFVQDTLPTHADSSAGIRFVNLSTGSKAVSVNIKGQANGSEAGNLSYKGITSFKNYAATASISSYIFEFRDVATGNLLTSYTLSGVNNSTGTNTTANTVRFKNLTIALIGQAVGTGTLAQKAILINNF